MSGIFRNVQKKPEKNLGFYKEFARVPPRDLLDATTNWGMRPSDPHAPHSFIARLFKYHEISPSYGEFFFCQLTNMGHDSKTCYIFKDKVMKRCCKIDQKLS